LQIPPFCAIIQVEIKMSLRQRNGEIITINTKEHTKSEILKLLPRKIFKYCSINEYTFNVLENNQLWFSAPNRFNDPFDCKIIIDFGKTKKEIMRNMTDFFPEMLIVNGLREGFEKNAVKTKRFNRLLNEMTHYAFDVGIGVCCFSEISNSPLMWAHYGNSHTGVCFIFDNTKRNLIRDNLIPVQYFKEYPEFNLSETAINEFQSFLLHAVSSKSDDWDYEFEWRAVVESGGNKLYDFQKDLLTGIIFGINTTTENKNKIKKIIKNKKYKNVRYYRAEIGDNDYSIKIRREEKN